jgi:hypothetical protein
MKAPAQFVAFLLAAVAAIGHAETVPPQTVKEAQKSFRDAVLHQQKYLRAFAADSEVRFRWDGSSLIEKIPQVRMTGPFIAESVYVDVKHDKVEIFGQVYALQLQKDSKVALSSASDAVHIEVDLNGADVSSLLPRLPDLLFYPSQAAAVADLRSGYGKLLPTQDDCCEARRKPTPGVSACDCAQLGTGSCNLKRLEPGMIGLEPPQVVHSVDPEVSDEALTAHFRGRVEAILDVDPSGHPRDLWITRPAGYGLDQKAAEALGQYRFIPATCHGQPVSFDLYIDVGFQLG